MEQQTKTILYIGGGLALVIALVLAMRSRGGGSTVVQQSSPLPAIPDITVPPLDLGGAASDSSSPFAPATYTAPYQSTVPATDYSAPTTTMAASTAPTTSGDANPSPYQRTAPLVPTTNPVDPTVGALPGGSIGGGGIAGDRNPGSPSVGTTTSPVSPVPAPTTQPTQTGNAIPGSTTIGSGANRGM